MKARSAPSTPIKAPSAADASSSLRQRSRARNLTGSDSICARSRDCSASTAVGQAPNDPWLRKLAAGSRAQWRRSILLLGFSNPDHENVGNDDRRGEEVER